MDILKNNPLFKNINPGDLHKLLKCLQSDNVIYQKEQIIIHSGERTKKIGILISGKIHIINDDCWGNRTIIKEIIPGELFGEAYACLPEKNFIFSIIAKEKCEVLYLDISKILHSCKNNCLYHQQLIENLLMITASKNILLTKKINHLTNRSIRKKILAYLSDFSKECGSNSFKIPFNRQQLANYLAVDRSALSFELSKMQKEGIISYHKNYFNLL